MDVIADNQDVLLVEDCESDARLIMDAFVKYGPAKNIMWLDDGKKAVEYIKNWPLKFRDTGRRLLVLLDLYLPKMNGFELLDEIKSCVSEGAAEFVIISGSENEKDLLKGYSLGAKAFINKDIIQGNCINIICGGHYNNAGTRASA